MNLIKIISAENQLRAEYLKTFLSSEGIECMLRSNTLAQAKAPQTTYDILVLEEDFERVKSILGEYKI